MLSLNNLSPSEGSRRNRKRVARGPGSGRGKTATRGHKGARSRSGYTNKPGFEGGQMPLQRRIPKRGFKNIFRTEYAIVNLDTIDALKDDAVVTPELLVEKGVIKDVKDGIKVLGNGSIQRPVTIKAHAFSAAATAKIEAAGGKTEVI